MDKSAFEAFWLDFYDKFFKMDTNGDQFVSVMETIAYFDAHDIESFRQAGAYLKNADLNLGRKALLSHKPFMINGIFQMAECRCWNFLSRFLTWSRFSASMYKSRYIPLSHINSLST